MNAPAYRSVIVGLLLTFIAGTAAWAQSGTVTGTITDAESGEPLSGVDVRAQTAAGQTAASGLTNQEGVYRITGLAAGTYTVVVRRLGYAAERVEDVQVESGATVRVDATLTERAFDLNPVIVSVSKQAEQAFDAPATVAVVEARAIEERPALSPVEHVRGQPGVDLITYGLQSSNVVTRGFNNLFSGSLYTLTDHRIASVPSLRVNLLHFVPANNEDFERMEVVLGPGSALYGPNTANGVLHMMTRSPLDEQGTTLTVGGGERDVIQSSFRTAQLVSDDFGIKASGQYLRGQEWEFTDPAEQIARDSAIANPAGCRAVWIGGGIATTEADRRCTRVGQRDFSLERWGLDVRADWRATPELTAVLSGGATRAASAIEITGIGAAQATDWTSYYYQARGNYRRWFGQVYLNGSDAGDTFLLQNGATIIDRSKLLVAQLQHGTLVGERQDFSYGIDYLRTMPETEGTINGGHEHDDVLTEFGGFLQSRTALADAIDLVLAGRLDTHSEVDGVVFSPRAAVVYRPSSGHNLRATYNSAFEMPSSLNMFLDIHGGLVPNETLASLGYGLRAQGPGSAGIDLVTDAGQPRGMRSPFNVGNRNQLLPVDGPTMWALAVGVMQAQGAIDAATAAEMLALNASGVGINALDPNTSEITSLENARLADVPGIEESRQSTFEVGYKGRLADDRVLFAADAWYTKKSNFISPLIAQTPVLLLEGQSTVGMLVPYYMSKGMTQDQATAAALQVVQGDPTVVGDGIAEVPLAVASSPDVNAVGADMLVTYRNFGEVDLWGADVSATVLLTDEWNLGVSASYVSDDHFRIPLSGTEEIVTLNAPALKGSASLGYRAVDGPFNGELRLRHTGEFPANSAGYVGLRCIGIADSAGCVEGATLVDLTAGYELGMVPGVSLQLTVQNLFDTPYRSFVRVPEIGRMALLRLRYQF